MDINAFIKSPEWLEVKTFLIDEFIEKPMKIKTEGKSAEAIAIEVVARNVSCKKLALALKKFERKAKPKIVAEKPFR